MASVLVYSSKVFNIFNTMGQSQGLPIKNDPVIYSQVSPFQRNPTKQDAFFMYSSEPKTKELPTICNDSSTSSAIDTGTYVNEEMINILFLFIEITMDDQQK